MIRSDCPPNHLTFGMVIHSFCRNGFVDRAMAVLDQMSECGCRPGVIIYNELISCFAELGRVDETLELFDSMRCKPDNFSYNAVMKGLCRAERWGGCRGAYRADRWEDVGDLLAEMVRNNMSLDEATFGLIIECFVPKRTSGLCC
ncbi:hypothetical protein EJB05_21690, partial [Eragrostis curvula]